MRYLIAIFVFSLLGSVTQAQQQSMTSKALTPESTGAPKLKAASPEGVVKAGPYIGDLPIRRSGSSAVSKSTAADDSEPGSWRMVFAAVVFMFVIAVRRQRSGKL
jgi:hypothetical protein